MRVEINSVSDVYFGFGPQPSPESVVNLSVTQHRRPEAICQIIQGGQCMICGVTARACVGPVL